MTRPLEVMVSSRNGTPLVGGGTLTDLRKRIKATAQELLARPDGEVRVKVWINEDSEAIEGSTDWYDESMHQVKRADVVLVLFSGDAGTVAVGRSIGICHAELHAAIADAPTKLRAVDVRALVAPGAEADATTHAAFHAAYAARRFQSKRPKSADDAVDDAVDAIGAAVHALALGGVTAARRGQRALGAALDWRRMTFAARRSAMEVAVVEALDAAGGARVEGADRLVTMPLAGETVLFVAQAAPEGLSLAASRELVGQPHRNDHQLVGALAGASGPVHVLACPGGVTAQQLRTLMGATDLVTAVTPTCVWAADTVSRGQVLALRDCIDATAVLIHLEAAIEWLRQSGEDVELAKRARRRRAILQEISAAD